MEATEILEIKNSWIINNVMIYLQNLGEMFFIIYFN